VIQKKTGRPVQFEITEQARSAIGEWLAAFDTRRGRYLFPSRFRRQPHLSTRQYARIVHRWVERAGLDSSAYGTHSLRRTKAAQIYRKTGNLRAVQLLLGHTKPDYLPHRTISRSIWRGASHGLLMLQARDIAPCRALPPTRRTSAHSVHYLLAKHVAVAARTRPSLSNRRVSPHVLRHAAAMDLLQQGIDLSVIALWLGHESIETTQIYLDADLELRQRVLDAVAPPDGKPGRYRPDDKLLAFLTSL
jgi:site-specific recombinase XerD